MQFTAKFASTLLAVAATAGATKLSARKTGQQQAALSVIFYDDTYLRGATYSPDALDPVECSTLPFDWLDRPQSVYISAGFYCLFFVFEGCEGSGTTLSGIVNTFPSPVLDAVESLICFKTVP